ncbi:hypothetical protein CEXT_384051 [Caerostris extrusa]|uniref:Uncharacterized protein n=1 Tax=Caerostris extrusa TaxID=172846 RepID=A0AAV4Y990_CAEEX|nr:hypothetical protein CEXT_384051 [Caerostris extrusa]
MEADKRWGANSYHTPAVAVNQLGVPALLIIVCEYPPDGRTFSPCKFPGPKKLSEQMQPHSGVSRSLATQRSRSLQDVSRKVSSDPETSWKKIPFDTT